MTVMTMPLSHDAPSQPCASNYSRPEASDSAGISAPTYPVSPGSSADSAMVVAILSNSSVLTSAPGPSRPVEPIRCGTSDPSSSDQASSIAGTSVVTPALPIRSSLEDLATTRSSDPGRCGSTNSVAPNLLDGVCHTSVAAPAIPPSHDSRSLPRPSMSAEQGDFACLEGAWADGSHPGCFIPASEGPVPEAWEMADLEEFFGPDALLL